MRSIILSQEEIAALTKEVVQKNLKKVTAASQYESLRVKDKDIFFVLYNTGKMVFQESKGFYDLLDRILIREEHNVIGTDEAGKGEWYGPLVVAGVALTPEDTISLRKMGVSDSKGLSPFRIYEIGNVLQNSEIKKEVKILPPEIYNNLYADFKKEKKNLNDILLWAHGEIINDLLTRIHPEKTRVVVDKFDSSQTPKRFETPEKFKVPITQKTGGESEVAVAAASVLAKFTFEEELKKLNQEFALDVRTMNPEEIPEEILPVVAKLHFKNVKRIKNDLNE